MPDASLSTASMDLPAAATFGLHLAPVGFAEVADLHQRVDEEAQAELGRQSPGRRVRRINKAELLQVPTSRLRTEAGESGVVIKREILREPTGSPGGKVSSRRSVGRCRASARELRRGSHLRRADRDVVGQ